MTVQVPSDGETNVHAPEAGKSNSLPFLPPPQRCEWNTRATRSWALPRCFYRIRHFRTAWSCREDWSTRSTCDKLCLSPWSGMGRKGQNCRTIMNRCGSSGKSREDRVSPTRRDRRLRSPSCRLACSGTPWQSRRCFAPSRSLGISRANGDRFSPADANSRPCGSHTRFGQSR